MDGNFAVQTAPEPAKAAMPKSNLRERVESLRLPDENELRGSGLRWLVWVVVIAVLGAGGFFTYRKWLQPERQLADATNALPASEKSPSTTVASSSPATAPHSTALPKAADSTGSVASSGEIAHESKGYVIPAHQILVSPKVPGMITMLRIEEGMRVQKDDVLAQLETTDYDAEHNRAKAAVESAAARLLELQHGSRKEEIAQAQAELQESEALRNQFAAELQRITQLHRTGVSTQSEYDLAESNYKTTDRKVERLRKAYDLMVIGPREERIAVAKAELELAKADETKAKWRLDNTTIRACLRNDTLEKC